MFQRVAIKPSWTGSSWHSEDRGLNMRTLHVISVLALLGTVVGCSEARTAMSGDLAASRTKTETQASAPPVSGSTACPGSDFASFLQVFASDDRIRERFTAPSVLVTEWRNADEPSEGTEDLRIAKADYRGFTLRFQGGAFHNIAADGTVDPQAEDVKITRADRDYLVGYVYGMSEGNSWRFTGKDGCWFLSADPEPSSL